MLTWYYLGAYASRLSFHVNSYFDLIRKNQKKWASWRSLLGSWSLISTAGARPFPLRITASDWVTSGSCLGSWNSLHPGLRRMNRKTNSNNRKENTDCGITVSVGFNGTGIFRENQFSYCFLNIFSGRVIWPESSYCWSILSSFRPTPRVSIEDLYATVSRVISRNLRKILHLNIQLCMYL